MSTQLSPEQRSERARVAAFTLHSQRDPSPNLAKAREALWNRYRVQVDPDNVLDEHERDRRARAAMNADLSRKALVRLSEKRREREEQAEKNLADSLLGLG